MGKNFPAKISSTLFVLPGGEMYLNPKHVATQNPPWSSGRTALIQAFNSPSGTFTNFPSEYFVNDPELARI
jgi:hypothetical protein